MTARHSSLGITSENYDEMASSLTELIEVMRHAKFGQDGKWKPFQRGFIVSTTSLLELSEFLLKKKGFNFFLAGRLLQDCLENLFSIVRSGNPKKDALQIRDAIKQISISEYMSPQLRHSAYNWSDNEFLSDFLTIVRQVQSENSKQNEQVYESDKQNLDYDLSGADMSKVTISSREQNVLYKVACYILFKIISCKVKQHCTHCLSFCQLPSNPDQWPSHTKLVRQPNYQYNCNKSVVHVKEDIYSYFLQMEKYFRCAYPLLAKQNKYNLGKLITSKILDQGFKIDVPFVN